MTTRNSKAVRQSVHKCPLAARREELGISQVELADILGRSDQTISNWESGTYACRLSVAEFKKLCQVFKWKTIEDIPDRLGPEI